MIKTVNLELNRPTVDEAIKKLERSIGSSSKGDCIIFIHGYGSTGKGGDIKIKVRKYLTELKKKGKITTLVKAEDFSITSGVGYNYEAVSLRVKYQELKQYAFQRNQGVTVIEI